MTFLVPIALFSWMPIVLLLFALMPPRRAVLVSFAAGWMFLPMGGYNVPGLPDYDKTSATAVAVLLGVLFFDSRRLTRFKPRWFDLPALIWCTSGFMTSMSNGLGTYDGLSVTFSQIVIWGIPYFLGRLYFSDQNGLRDLAVAIFIGGLIYIPFCLFEIRMSPHLHKWVYGYQQHAFGQTKRWGGYRPTVFLQHGLMVGMWMTAASLMGVWLWKIGALKHVGGIPMSLLVPVLLVTTILCKSTGALILLLVGMATLVWIWRRQHATVVLLLAVLAVFYVTARGTGMWSGEMLVFAVQPISSERADSLRIRMKSENVLAEKARQQPIFGWGGWSRSQVFSERGRAMAITDGMWIIAFAQRGLVGLVGWLSMMLLPAMSLLRLSPRDRTSPRHGGVVALVVVLVLYLIDCLMNAMLNPIFTLAIGGLVTLHASLQRRRERKPVLRIQGEHSSALAMAHENPGALSGIHLRFHR